MLISLMHFFGYFNRMLGPGVDPCRRRNGINIALIWRGRGTAYGLFADYLCLLLQGIGVIGGRRATSRHVV